MPVTKQIKTSKKFKGFPEIVELNYDVWTVRVTLDFENIDHPVYLTFKNVEGFRVLDEGNLLEFWDKKTRADGWLWEVKESGWQDQEKTRDGYFNGKTNPSNPKEYMIVGITDCLNILTYDEPLITEG